MIAAATLGDKIQKIVIAKIETGKLSLPAMPQVAAECLELLRDRDFSQRKLVARIETEPLLAALLIRNASSAAYAGAVPVTTLDQAVTRIGAQRIKAVIVEYASRELFQSREPKISAECRRVWDHSIAVAQLSRDLGALTGGAAGDTCYLAGLLHDVGKPIVAAMLLEAERGVKAGSSWIDPAAWTSTIDAVHRQVGVAVATQWKLPPEIASAIRDCNDYDTDQRDGIANIVRLANALAKRCGYTTGPVDESDLEALIMIGRSMIGTSDDVIDRLTAGLKDRLTAVA
jgi:putative nucleotidyltransferase with HDIG domain